MVTAVVADNGESTLAECLESLRRQTMDTRVVVAAGPKTDLELAEKLAHKVYPPTKGIGRARVNAILNEEDEFFLSCDSDTVYSPTFAEIAAQDLKLLNAVKAGMILPRDHPKDILLAWFEAMLNPLVPYEFALAFRKSAFINAGIHQVDYSNPRGDIGLEISRRMYAWMPIFSDPRMVCWTRLPTKGAEIVRDNYLPSIILGAAVPFGALAGIIGLNELKKLGLS